MFYSEKLKSVIKSFTSDQSGNVAILFGMAIIPIFAVVGISIDYGRAASARSAMQSAADATSLMIAREAAGLSPTELKTKAEAYFRALLDRPDLTGVSVAAVYSTDSAGQQIKIDASANITNTLMSMPVLGSKPATAIGTSSTARWGARYRVAIALDNTGSMASASKMTELKKAAKAMVNDFAAMAKKTEDIYISIVPFSLDVNVGTSNKNQDWVSWDYIGTCSQSSKKNGPDCRAANKTWTTTNAQKNAWNGCVSDRDEPHAGDYDLKNTLPNPAVRETLFDADGTNVTWCPVSMIGMTSVYSNKQDLIDKVDSMIPVGNTNQTIGLAWAWMTHTIGAGPFPAPAKNTTMEYKDVIILLTDGDNTENRWDSCSASSSNCKIDNRQATLCNTIKSSTSIDIYTVQVATGSDAVQPVLKNCSSKPNDPAYFSYITNAAQLSTKFRDIFESIARLRVSS